MEWDKKHGISGDNSWRERGFIRSLSKHRSGGAQSNCEGEITTNNKEGWLLKDRYIESGKDIPQDLLKGR